MDLSSKTSEPIACTKFFYSQKWYAFVKESTIIYHFIFGQSCGINWKSAAALPLENCVNIFIVNTQAKTVAVAEQQLSSKYIYLGTDREKNKKKKKNLEWKKCNTLIGFFFLSLLFRRNTCPFQEANVSSCNKTFRKEESY